jgi:predicted transcriptional regulator of viral defense system
MLGRMADAGNVRGNNSPKRSSDDPDRLIGEVAARQYGIITCAQLRANGLSREAIKYRLRLGRLLPLYRAVYAVGHDALTREARWLAGVLACGEGAVLSHQPATAHWHLWSGWAGKVHVTVPSKRRPARGIRLHKGFLPPDEMTVHRGIPITTVPRTIFDMAATLRPRQVERLMNEAEVLRLWDPLSLHDLLDRYPRRPGAPAVRAALIARSEGATFTRSDLEEMFIELLDEAGLPRPETNVILQYSGRTFEVDCLWRRERLIVELDAYGTHSTRASFEGDRERDQILAAARWRVVRVTDRQMKHSPAQVKARMRDLLGTATLAA